MTSPALLLERVTCTFASRERQSQRYTAVKETTLSVGAGEFVSVVGPTGCGKSTLLNVAAGLLQPSSGNVRVQGEPLAGINRRAGYMFQAESLMPWRNALDNVLAGLEFAGVARDEAERRAREWLGRVGLTGFERRFPHELSGGMRKRVALAQMLILDPQLLLMDEPFSALDVQTRQLMENELLDLWSADRKSVLFITHDLEEAIALSDRV
ncbi:MAG TPA: ABC transporter ATP-binding protein, partial [Casimicrobiaceae bacterium]|nr:ABC transporter ATP-binding protein [Casimicrobiaceae bacterium]